ncbi:MAG: hypothetical protein Q8P95_01950, partial [bacterium]|nr:hypothetical protein [bacterium]
MVRLIRIDFREGGEFTHQDQVMAQVREALQFGGIFVSGGSWFNSFDSHGRFLREQISRPACEASLTFDSQVRRLDLCFSYQTDADELAPFLGLDGLQTSPGALEFGPSSLRVMEMGHPLFRDLPRRLSVAQTHASHVLFPPGLFGGESRLRILCTSGLTGLPIGYDVRGPHKRKGNPDIRILALQCHPEIGVDRRGQLDWERVMKEVRAKREGLVPAFGADVISLIDQNIRLGHQVIRADAGPELLMNGLICLVDSLLN